MLFSDILMTAATASAGPALWTPLALGADLLGYWDAENTPTLTLSGSNVSSWADAVNGYVVSQALSSLKPIYSATSFNGRPGLAFDGTDDYLTIASSPFPLGTHALEMWSLVSSTTIGSVVATKIIASHAGSSAADALRLRRIGTGTTSQGGSSTGTSSTSINAMNTTTDFVGRHVLRGAFGLTQTKAYVDNDAAVTISAVPFENAGPFVIGATNTGTAVFPGIMNAVLVTLPLSDSQAALLLSYLKTRGGIT